VQPAVAGIKRKHRCKVEEVKHDMKTMSGVNNWGQPHYYKNVFMLSTDKHYDGGLKEQNILKQIQENLDTLRQELIKSHRPANEVLLDDVDLQAILKVSKRHTAELREKKLIAYSQPIPNGKIYYILSDVIAYVKTGYHQTISSQRKF
jgi:hypothetical protein